MPFFVETPDGVVGLCHLFDAVFQARSQCGAQAGRSLVANDTVVRRHDAPACGMRCPTTALIHGSARAGFHPEFAHTWIDREVPRQLELHSKRPN